MGKVTSLRRRLLGDEQKRLPTSIHGRVRVGVGYPNSYHVAQSSLAFQWVVEITSRVPDVGVERFYAEPEIAGRTLESGSPLGDLDVLAWSCAFELDAVHILRTLDACGVPRSSTDRDEGFPLVVVGGSVAMINPLPLAPAVDVFCIGAAEVLWPHLLEMVRDGHDRETILDGLATRPGYFVPSRHLDRKGEPRCRIRRVHKAEAGILGSSGIPCSHVVTPHTEYRNRALVEISVGCPERCRYCWISHTSGRLRSYPLAGILERVDELRSLTDRFGFVATAVGDHPQLPSLLEACCRRGVDLAISSLRIPALVPEILAPLARSGARSITIAPETGSDALRRAIAKPVSNEQILSGVETAQQCGIRDLKMYFIIGLPGETDTDLQAIGSLIRRANEIVITHGRGRGRVGQVDAAFNVLVPKPYTPCHREGMLRAAEVRRRLNIVERAVRGIGNLRVHRPAYREAVLQGVLSRGTVRTFAMLERSAAGVSLGRLLSEHRDEVESAALSSYAGVPPWHFITSAPTDTVHCALRPGSGE